MQDRMSKPRDAKNDPVPRPGDPDRKRVLNVLAQRRYRKRRQERIQALEEESRKAKTGLPSPSSSEATPSPSANEDTEESTPCSDMNSALALAFNQSTQSIPLSDTQLQNINLPSSSSPSFSPFGQISTAMVSSLLEGYDGSNLISPTAYNPVPGLVDINSVYISPDFLQATTAFDVEPNTVFPGPAAYDFTDDLTFDLPTLKLMKAGFDIAEMLGCSENLLDAGYRHVLAPIENAAIPSWLQPTRYQQLIPHHPMIDLLPWPSVRNKLICAFSLPIQKRPPSAQDPMATMTMISDMDDEQEGIKIDGSEQTSGDCWEIGQVFFNNWWWAFEPSIVKNSNRLRERRGAAKLILPGTSGERA